jgi:dynein heavy chain
MTTLNALIVIDVHGIYVVKSLLDNNVADANAFEWISFLRYYWYDDNCHVKCI